MDDETCDEFVQRWVRLFRQQVRDRGPRVTWAGMARSPMRLPRRPADSPASPLQHIHIYRNRLIVFPFQKERKKKKREKKREEKKKKKKTSFRSGEDRVHSRRRGSRDFRDRLTTLPSPSPSRCSRSASTGVRATPLHAQV